MGVHLGYDICIQSAEQQHFLELNLRGYPISYNKQYNQYNTTLQYLNMDTQVLKSKVVFVGDQSVGKTSIINRFIFDNYTGNEQPTVGVDFVSKTVQIENKTLRIQLWDTAGQQRFHSLIPSYIKDSAAAIIVYDITNPTSFESINRWLEQIREVRGDDVGVYVFGNKTDLDSERKVSIDAAKEKLSQMGLQLHEGSAKTGAGIKEFFKVMTYRLAGALDGKRETPNDNGRKKEIVLPRSEGTTLSNMKSNQRKKDSSCSC